MNAISQSVAVRRVTIPIGFLVMTSLFLAGPTVGSARAQPPSPFTSDAIHFPGSTWMSWGVCVGDVNRDGQMDVMFANDEGFGGNALFLNQDGDFSQSAPQFTAGNQKTTAMAFGDLDGDGDLDLVCANEISANVAYRNNGAGFPGEPFWSTEVLRDTRDLALADLDGDGRLDVVTANNYSPNEIYFNGPTGLATTPGWISPETTNSWSVACGDVNGDGFLDLVFAHGRDSTTLFLNSAAGFTQTVSDWSSVAGDPIGSVALGDLDGDGDLDLVCGNVDGPSRVYLNVGGVFEQTPHWSTPGDGDPTTDVDLGDIDLDGDLDLVCGNYEANNTLFLNDGTGNFGLASVWIDGPGDPTEAITLADLNGDGLLDLVCANRGGDNTWYLNRLGPLETVPSSGLDDPAILGTFSVALGDIDQDGDLDLVCGAGDPSQPNGLFLNNGGTFEQISAWNPVERGWTRALALGDVNGDGLLDVVCGNYSGASTLHLNTGGGFGPDVWGNAEERGTNDIALGDVDGDGDLDLVCGNGPDDHGKSWRSTLFLNRNGGFSPLPDWESGPAKMTEAVALGDINGDGALDLVCGQAGDSLAVYLNTGGSFGRFPSWQSADAPTTRSLALGDVDGDGDLDLVCGNGGVYQQATTLYTNEGGVFSRTETWHTSDSGIATDVVLCDLDADGDLDLIRAMYDGPNRVHLNTAGRLAESASLVFDATRTTRGLAVGDVDGDNDPDLVCANTVRVNTLYRGHYGSAWRASAASTADQLAHHPAYVQDVHLAWKATNTYRVELTAVDSESDAAYVVPEYQLVGDPTWYPADLTVAGRPLGPLTASPRGVTHELQWNVNLAPIDRRDVVLRLRTFSTSSQVSRFTAIPAYLCAPLPLQVNRPQIAVPLAALVFDTMTVGDVDSLNFEIRNTGTEILHVTGAELPGAEMRLTTELPLALDVGETAELQILLEPRATTDLSGTLQLSSDDPLTPSARVSVTTNILPLGFVSRLLTQEAVIPLGEAVTAIITPGYQVNMQGGFLFHRPAGAGTAFVDSLPLIPDAEDFIAIIQGDAVTEVGLEYYVRVENNGVFATNPVGAPAAVNFQAVQVPTQVTLIPVASTSAGHPVGREVLVGAELGVGARFVEGVLYYRRGGEWDYRQAPFAAGEPRPFAVIPDTLADESGIEYWCSIRTLTAELVDPPVNPAGRPRVLPVLVEGLAAPEAVAAGLYRMISVPVDFGDSFTGTLESMLYAQSSFGSYDPVRWRSYRYLPELGQYREFPEDKNAFVLRPGRAFWLICHETQSVTTAPLEGYSPSTAGPWLITLAPGWNQVGQPFAFAVPWDSVTVAGLSPAEAVAGLTIEQPVRWDWTSQTYARDVVQLEMFSGIWIRNLTDADVVLAVPPVRAAVAAAKRGPSVVLQKAGEPDPGHDWALRVVAVCGSERSHPVWAAVDARATVGRDTLDLSKVPGIPGPELSLYFPHAEWGRGGGPISKDVRPVEAAQSGWLWDLDLTKTFAREGVADEVVLEFSGLQDIPVELAVVLHDRLVRRTIDLRTVGSYTLQMGTNVGASTDARARFQLLVGDEAYIQESLETADVPAVTALLPNRPNPFNPATLLRFDLDRPALVELTIHDVRGHTVARVLHERIEAGRREVLWSGRDDSGRPVAAGAYFYRLSTEFGFNATGKMMLVR